MAKKKIDEPKPKKRFAHLISTAVKEYECPCGALVWAAYDDGLAAKAEKDVIDPRGEWQILAQGYRTYTRQPWGGLRRRDAAEISAGLRPGETIHIEHQHRSKK